MKKAIDIIEQAKSYYLLSKDHKYTGSKPVYVGGRIKLELALQTVDKDMIIATSGNDKKCIILMDYSEEECWALVQKGNRLMSQYKRLKAKN